MTYQTTITATRNPRWSTLATDETPSGCFGIFGFRSSSSSSLRKLGKNRKSRGRSPPSRLVPDVPLPSDPELKGYVISGKSAEILGLTPKNRPNTRPSRPSGTALPVPWRSLSGNEISSLRSDVKSLSVRSEKSATNFSMHPWAVPIADEKSITSADSIVGGRRPVSGESSASTVSSSSESAPSRNYSYKWGKAQRPHLKDIEIIIHRTGRDTTTRSSIGSGKNFYDPLSMPNSPCRKDDVFDTNKADTLLIPQSPTEIERSACSASRIRSAAFTTFAWMELQSEAMARLSGSDSSWNSWLLIDSPGAKVSLKVNVANESRKRSIGKGHKASGSMESGTLGDNKRDALERMDSTPEEMSTPTVRIMT